MSRRSPETVARRVVLWLASLSAVALGGCPGSPAPEPGEELEPCEAAGAACAPQSDSRGSWARFCALTADPGGGTSRYCLNVCNHPADFAAGSQGVGQTCEYDVDCAPGASCDNDVVGGTATCKCLAASVCETDLTIGTTADPFPPEGVVDEPEAWSHVGVCRYANGDCQTRSVPITIVQGARDRTRFLWGYAFDDCGGPCPWPYEGRLCASDAAWSGPSPLGGFETGTWHFGTADRFDATGAIYDSPGGEVLARCMISGMRLRVGEAESPIDCLDYHPFDCVPDHDIEGTFQTRVKCSEDHGGTAICVDDDEAGTITFTATSTPGEYTFGDPAGFSGRGRLCANLFEWEAEDVVYRYTERGVYVFEDGDTFAADVHHASTYRYTGSEIEGYCTATGQRGWPAPEPDTVGACP